MKRWLALSVLLVACRGSDAAPSSGTTAVTASVAVASSAPETSAPVASVPLASAPPPAPSFRSSARVDLWVRGGMLVDGSGSAPVRGDLVIDDGRIVHAGAVDPSLAAERTVDASGKVVSPGFIDAHAHGDPEGDGESWLAQGVTTILLGQDGRSASDDRVRDWVRRVGRKRLAIHAATLSGHGTVRELAKIGLTKPPNERELQRMAALVAADLDAGAFGLSTGLEYRPGSIAEPAELAAIAKPVGERGGVVMSHLRSEDDDRIDAALDELLAQGRSSGARVHVAHVKVVYGRGAARAEKLLARMAAARTGGLALTADIYPYSASYTTVGIVFPDFAKPPARYARVKHERRDDLATFLRERVEKRGGPEKTLFGTAPYRGQTLADVARAANKPFWDVLIDDIGPNGASAAYFVMDDELQARLLRDPLIMVGSDGGPQSRHPRGYGSFARILAVHVRERKELALEEAIRKMTSLTAATIGLSERGALRPGYWADVVVFDPAAVRDEATYEEPSRLAKGMNWVLVAGVPVIAEGRFTGKRAGRVLTRTP